MVILQFGVVPPPEGGVQSNVQDLYDFTRAQGIRCGVVHLSRHRQQDHDDIFYPKTPLQVAKIALTFPADVFHFHLGGSIQREQLALYTFATSIPGKKSVFTLHSGGYPSTPEGKRPHAWRDFVFRRFDRIIGVNEEMLAMFRRFGVRQERLRLIPPFALPAAAPSVTMPPVLAEFLESHSPVLLSVAGFEPEYDIALQIEAMAEIVKTHPRAGLLVAGSGSLESELRVLHASKSYKDSILLAGNVPRSITMNLMTRTAIFLRTTWYDGDAVSVREALHFGMPVIASDNGMRPEGVTLISARDREKLVFAVLNQLAMPPRERIIAPPVTRNLEAVLQVYKELARS